jgi:hypothetical protein
MVEILWHSQTKARETVNTNLNLNRRATRRAGDRSLTLRPFSTLPVLTCLLKMRLLALKRLIELI